MTYGEKISRLRKSVNMTQQQLGDYLNVSAQAVSKWEKDLAEPDLTTIKKIAEKFNISTDEFLDVNNNNIAAVTTTQVAEKVASTVVNAVNSTKADGDMVGICACCGKVVNSKDVGQKNPKILCKQCFHKLRKKKIAKIQMGLKELKS